MLLELFVVVLVVGLVWALLSTAWDALWPPDDETDNGNA
jgi:hypothetical protein